MSYGTALLILLISTVILVPTTWIVITKVYGNDELFNRSKNTRIFVHVIVFLAYGIPGSIPAACMLGLVAEEMLIKITDVWEIFLIIFLVVLCLIVQFCLFMLVSMLFGVIELETYWNGETKKRYITYFILSIIALVFWTIPIATYNTNVETKHQTSLENVEQIELVEFAGIPVEKLAKEGDLQDIDESQISEVVFSDSLKYCYLNDEGKKESKTIDKEYCIICFTSESESPYLEIRKYKKNHITIDNNKGSEKKSQESNTTKYIFYLPEETFDKILAKG